MMADRQALLLQVLQTSGLLPAQSTHSVCLQHLTGGFWNRVYRLRSEQPPPVDWVVKQFAQTPLNPLFPILPDAEAAALQFLQAHDCAPKPIGFLNDSPAGSVLVYEYVQGSGWNGDLEASARLLAQIHRIPVDTAAARAFRQLPTEAPDLLTHAEQMLQRHRSPLSERIRAVKPPAPPQSVSPRHRPSLVHTDCGPGNMVSSPDGLRLIDWQCPGIGDGLQDVVTFISPAMQWLYGHPVLTHAQEQTFLAAYFAALHQDLAVHQESLERLQCIRASHHYRFAAYCAMRTQDTAASDEKTSQLYSAALRAEIQLLETFQ